MKISSNNYRGFPMFPPHVPCGYAGWLLSELRRRDRLFTMIHPKKNQGLGCLGLGSVNDWSPWTSKWIWKNKRCEDEIFEYIYIYYIIYIYIILYIYYILYYIYYIIYIWEVLIARPCLVDEPILQKCLHDQLFRFLKFDYWIYQFVMFVVSLSSCTVVLMSCFFHNYWFLDPVDDLQSLIVLRVTGINYWLVNCYDLARLEKAPLWKAMKLILFGHRRLPSSNQT